MDYGQKNIEYTDVLGKQIQKRLANVSRRAGVNFTFNQDKEGIHWSYKGVECQVQFYEDTHHPINLEFRLTFPKDDELAEKVKCSISGNKINDSKYLRRPSRVYVDGEKIQDQETGSYLVKCSIKRIPKSGNERDNMLSEVWGHIISKMLGTASDII